MPSSLDPQTPTAPMISISTTTLSTVSTLLPTTCYLYSVQCLRVLQMWSVMLLTCHKYEVWSYQFAICIECLVTNLPQMWTMVSLMSCNCFRHAPSQKFCAPT